MFSELDKDFDGKLSWREFIGEETTTERAFKLFDENHDGKISKSVMNRAGSSELVRLLTCLQEFQRFCHNLSRDQVDAAFAKFDTSGGKIGDRQSLEMIGNLILIISRWEIELQRVL